MRHIFTDPTPAGLCLLLTLLTLLTAAVVVGADPPAEGQQGPSSRAVEAMITELIELAPRHLAHDPAYRRELSDAIASECSRRDLPVSLIVAMAYRESSLRHDVVGPAGEVGVMQVHPATARKHGCDVSTIAGQVSCGCTVLDYHRARCCGDLRGALGAYGSRSGSCTPAPDGPVARMVADRFALARRLSAHCAK